MKYVLHSILLIIFCIGCSQKNSEDVPLHLNTIEHLTIYPKDVESQKDIYFTRAHVYEESEEILFGRIFDVVIDDTERVYISESAEGHAAIHVFDQDGKFLTSLGGYGEGPGEFKSIIQPQISGEKLYALDGLQQKINVYSLQKFTFERSIQLNPENWIHIEELADASPYNFAVLNNNRILLTFLRSEGRKDLVLRYMMNASGKIISEKIIEQVSAENFVRPDNDGIFFSPFSSSGLLAITGSKKLYTIWTEEIFFKEYSIDGEYQRSFYHPFANKELRRSDVLDYYDSEIYRASVRNTGFPEKWPAIHFVLVDDLNHFWISTIIENESDYEWWVMNSKGEILTKFIWPRSKKIEVVTDESLFAIEIDSLSGIQKVVKYRFRYE